MYKPEVRKIVTNIETIYSENYGEPAKQPLRKISVAAVIKNPLAGDYHEDLTALMDCGAWAGEELTKIAVNILGEGNVVCYGKGAIIGLNGELEHAAALIHPELGAPMRKLIGGGLAIIPSSKKVGSAGTTLDVPLHYKDACFVRTHYNSMEVRIPDAPRNDEAVIIAVFTDGGRINARVGGLLMSDVKVHDGQR
jgi:hypothetical protein